jgi:hypothetical protein
LEALGKPRLAEVKKMLISLRLMQQRKPRLKQLKQIEKVNCQNPGRDPNREAYRIKSSSTSI